MSEAQARLTATLQFYRELRGVWHSGDDHPVLRDYISGSTMDQES